MKSAHNKQIALCIEPHKVFIQKFDRTPLNVSDGVRKKY